MESCLLIYPAIRRTMFLIGVFEEAYMSSQPKKKLGSTYKVERLEARISKQEKILFAKAAAIQGRSLSEFVVSSLHNAASQVIQAHEIIRLAEQDRETFVNALLNPPEPNKNLKAAAKRYSQLIGK